MTGPYWNGKVTEDFWQRKQAEWHKEELRIKSSILGLEESKSGEKPLAMRRILELA